MRSNTVFENAGALRALVLLATVGSVPAQAQVYDSASMYSPDSGGLPTTTIAMDGYIPVPTLWHYNPVVPASAGNPPLPQLKDRLTYSWQQNHAPHIAALFVHVSATPLVSGDQKFYLQRTMEWLDYENYPLHYVFADLEEGYLDSAHSHVLAMLNQVRAYPDPAISAARVGNYADFPGPYSYYSAWPEPYPAQGANSLIRTSNGDPDDAFYRNSGLDLAMPVAYPNSVGSTHAVENYWGIGRWTDPATGSASTFSLVAPNQRSAFFWAPLEAVSTAARNLTGSLASHEIIPFISMMQTHSSYPVAPGQNPTLEDYKASLTHYRLRGVDGFRAWASTVNDEAYGVTYTTYREAMRDTWNGMNGFFAAAAAMRIINTGTNCVDGVEWSAAQKGNRVLALISNLTTAPKALNWDNAIALYTDRTKTRNVRQLPALSPSIPANTHRSLQYRSNYLDYEDMQTFAHGQSMNNQGERSWQGPNADRFVAQAPQGAGNGSSTAVSTTSDTPYADQVAWYEAPNPGFAATDQVVYSGYLYNGGAVSGFSPVNITNLNGAAEPGNDRQGFYVSIDWDMFTFRPSRTAGAIHQATNVIGAHDKWFEVRVVVDPTRDIDGTSGGSHGVARIFVRNLATGDKAFTPLAWDDLSTSGTVERQWELPLALDDALRKTTLFNGMMVVGNGPNVAMDNLNVGYHAPTLDDNMQHYAAATAMNLQTQPWKGPDAAKWQALAPQATGNGSTLAATPLARADYAWWKTERTDFAIDDLVVYSARVYGCEGVGFSPVDTQGTVDTNRVVNTKVGFYASTFWNKFRLRGTRDWGDGYEATNLACAAQKWYEIQVQVDQPNSRARVYVRNLTDGTAAVRLNFDNIATSGTVESETFVPLYLTPVNNANVWNGWEVYGYGTGVQIDDLKSFLYPYQDFGVAEYIDR